MKPIDHGTNHTGCILFHNWTALSEADKFRFASDLATTREDPVRMNLLVTLMALPEDQMMEVFDYALTNDNWPLAALVVQGMPDYLLEDDSLCRDLSEGLISSYTNDKTGFNREFRLVDQYPYVYALEKLKSRSSVCHQNALVYLINLVTHDAVSNIEKNRIKEHPAFMSAWAKVVTSRNGVGPGLKVFMETFMNDYGQPWNGVNRESLFYGDKDLSSMRSMDCLDMAIKAIGKEDLMNFLIQTTVDNDFNSDEYHFILCLIERAGVDEFISRLEDEIIKSSSTMMIFMIFNALGNDYYKPNLNGRAQLPSPKIIVTSLAQMHLRNVNKLEDSSLRINLNNVRNQPHLMEVYSSKAAFDAFMGLSIQNIANHEELNELDARAKLNVVMSYAIARTTNNKTMPKMGCYIAAESAAACLALSGDRYPDVISQLNKASVSHLIDLMQKLDVKTDRSVMLKINPEAKAKLFEMELGI